VRERNGVIKSSEIGGRIVGKARDNRRVERERERKNTQHSRH